MDIDKVEDYLERAFSYDVSVTVFLPMIEAEDNNPSYEHPPNWDREKSITLFFIGSWFQLTIFQGSIIPKHFGLANS